jgi:tripartite-type tricarboxylate transporter receptor subunit TctC
MSGAPCISCTEARHPGAAPRSPADGYTLLLVTTTNAINTTLYNNLGFSLIRDIALVEGIILVPNVMLVNPSVPAKMVPD